MQSSSPVVPFANGSWKDVGRVKETASAGKGCMTMCGRAWELYFSLSQSSCESGGISLSLAPRPPTKQSSSNDVALNHVTLYMRDQFTVIYHTYCGDFCSYPLVSPPPILSNESQCIYIFFFFHFVILTWAIRPPMYPSCSDSSINVPARMHFLEL